MIRLVASTRALLHRICKDNEGITLVEFAFVGPVLILMIMGVFDVAHTQYTSSMLNGAMQKAARDLTLENAGSRQGFIDERVREQVRAVVPAGAKIDFEKLSHFDFADIGQPEEVLGGNGDQVCDAGERFVDDNDNGQWDANRGKDGIGGARDAVLYTAIVTYPRMFPMFSLAGLPKDVRLEASSVLRNQPFDEQDRNAPIRDC
jgi:hypothetical protein